MATTHLIAVGTQGGFVLVFDSCQVGLSLFPFSPQTLLKVIKWFLGGLDLGSNYGAVSSLAFNTDSSRCPANGSKEQIVPPINKICDSAPCYIVTGY